MVRGLIDHAAMGLELALLTFPVPGLVPATAQMAETAGWDALYFADTQNLASDVYVSLGLAASVTQRIGLATGVTNPVTRHPAVAASAIASVQVAAAGRAVFGIGRGDSSLGFIGRNPAPVRQLEQYVTRVRAYLHGQPADLDGFSSVNEWIASSGQPPVPIDIAATGPKVTAVAARLADRLTFAVGANPERLRDAIALARRERAAAGLDPASLSIGAYVNAVAHPDPEMARMIVRGSAASFAHFSGMAGAPRREGSIDAEVFEKLGRDYDMADHARATGSHASALTDDFIDRFAVAGPVTHCVNRLSELIEVGVERLVLVPGSRDANPSELVSSMARLAAEVLPALR